MDNSKLITGTAANKLILKANATFSQATTIGARSAWTLQVDGAATLSVISGVANTGYYGWNGPIVLNDTLTIEANSTTCPFVFNGAISGTGALVYAGVGEIQMNGDAARTHTYTGGTTFSANCNAVLAAPGLLPTTAGAITAASGAKALVAPQASGDYALFTEEAVIALARALAAGADRAAEVYVVGSGASWPAYFTDAAAVTGTAAAPTLYSGFTTNAELRLTGAMDGFVNVAVRPNTAMSLAADNATAGWVEVNGGTLTLPAGVTLTASNRVFVGGADAAHVGHLQIAGTLRLTGTNSSWRGVSASSQALKDNVRATECGVVDIAVGATVRGTLGLNQGGCTDGAKQMATASGVYVLKGTAVATMESFLGDFRSEYFEIASGGVYSNLSVRTGRGTGYANLRVKTGGLLRGQYDGNDLNLAYNGGQTDLLVDGGRILVPNSGWALNRAENATTTGAYASFTVADGGEARFSAPSGGGWYGANVNYCSSSIAYLNLLDGGLLESTTLNRPVDRTANRVIVSFDGGVYAMRHNKNAIYQNQSCFANFATGEGTAGDHVFVFAQGATISNDTPTYVGFTLEAPTGKGVASIALPDEIADKAAWAIPSAPMVCITDATGYGATAIALYDAAAGKVTGVKVTSRGVNYTNPTITFSRGGLAAALAYADCCTLTDNVSGGFTKTGTGTLTVTNAMAYTGTTTVRQGTLKLGLDNAFETSSDIVVAAGATLDLNGKTSTRTVTGFGVVTGDFTLPADWTVDAAALNAATTALTASGNATIPSGTVVTIANPEQLDISKKYVLAAANGTLAGDCPALVCASPRAWTLVKTEKQLVLAFVRGIVINFR